MIPMPDVKEAAKIAVRSVDMLLATANDQKGTAGSDMRRACGDLKAFVENYIQDGIIATKLSECFVLARTTGTTTNNFNQIQKIILADYAPLSLTAVTVKNVCIWFSLQQMSLCITATTFTSREDVEAVRDIVNAAFYPAEENAADEMALAPYRALVGLHAAVVFFLYDKGRPLPRMLDYTFYSILPTLIISQRLYYSASKADALRAENKVVHPAFAAREGKALSF